MSNELAQLKAQLAALQAQNEALKAQASAKTKVTLKVGEKGNVMAYGIGRWPVTLYKSQWLSLLETDVKAFISAHETEIDKAAAWWDSLSPEQQKAHNDAKAAGADKRSALAKAVDQIAG